MHYLVIIKNYYKKFFDNLTNQRELLYRKKEILCSIMIKNQLYHLCTNCRRFGVNDR